MRERIGKSCVGVVALLFAALFALPSASAQVPNAQTGQSQAEQPPAQPQQPQQQQQQKSAQAQAKPKAQQTHGIIRKKKKPEVAKPDSEASAEPDKVLFDRAMTDVKHGRYTEARLSLQTLINTYPDSEYLAKAKLSVADSYYKEGGTSNLTEAIATYKDFITFFPFLDEAAYAQMQVAMCHFKMMEKPDRDKTEAEGAEDEFQAFLLKYPRSPLAAKAEQRLREVQEVLADADYRVASFYYTKGDFRAAAPRLLEVTERYPLYSESDHALFLLAAIFEKAEKREIADKIYVKLVREYPLSPLVPAAKRKLLAASVPVPPPDPAAVARMKKDREVEQQEKSMRANLMHLPMEMIKSSPDVSSATHSGAPGREPNQANPILTAKASPDTQVMTLPPTQTWPSGSCVMRTWPLRPSAVPCRAR